MSRWTIDQEKAITETGKNIIVSAGAGSGKTAVLTERTIRKLLNGTSINKLLILTFTNAAAGEMKDRIRKAIKKANLKTQLDYLDSAYITTFDSFALSLVKKYHLNLGLSKNISIMDNSIEELKTNEIIDEIFEERYGNPNFDKLINDFCIKSDENIKNVFKELSRKLDLVKDKENYLTNYIDNHFNDEFINSSINKYINLVLDTKENINKPYQNLCLLVDQKYLDDFNLKSLLEANTYEEVKEGLELIGSPRKNKNCDDNFKKYKDEISIILKKLKDLTRFNDILEMKESVIQTKPYIEEICYLKLEFDKRFLEYKKEKNIYTFTDIALMAIKVIKENKNIQNELRDMFDEIMIDEYQDTSNIQEEFINLISNNNVYMVGDIKQSIYRFRNANPYIFRDKYNNYSLNKGGIKIDLLKNFRSRKEVLNNINLIFNLIMDEEIGDADYEKSHQMNFGNTSYEENLKTNQNNNMEIISYNPKEIEGFNESEIEAFTICSDIMEKIKNKYQVVDKETFTLRDCTYGDFAIIMDRGTSFDLYKKIFEFNGVPIVQIKNEKLTIGDDLAILSNLINLTIKIGLNEIDDELKYYYVSICRSYLFRLSDEEIFDIINNNQICNSKLYNILKDINIFEISNIDLINILIDKFDIYNKLITTNNIEESIIKLDYLKELSINLSDIGYSVIMFADYLKSMLKSESIEYSLNNVDDKSVKILNIHKSKGLEYNICYYSGLGKKSNDEDKKSKFIVDSNFNIITPYIKDGVKENIYKDLLIDKYIKENISEKIRLFYVALTRAKEKIILLLPTTLNETSFTSLVPVEERLKYNKISDMLLSIYNKLKPYIKDIDIGKINLTHDYEKIKFYNYQKEISSCNKKINKHFNDINYVEINESRYSKNTNKLISSDEYKIMEKGKELHYLFEIEDFKTSDNILIKKFMNHISKDYIKEYKEFEFIYNDDLEERHGIIDLMLEYDDHIDIIDYKLKNIVDENYIKQLTGYKNYIKSIINKKVNIYLYSIFNDTMEKITSCNE